MNNTLVFTNRIRALKFANKVKGQVKWFQTMGTIKRKDKFTGKIRYIPALVTNYKVYY